ncbi:MAG TPA: SDR family oxidoreductase [Steroidobacteraceae bacterium]|nr:SDR family oxidoreductase [Steroidobacteraceae bacterium]
MGGMQEAVVTGSAGGIGSAIVRELIGQGKRVHGLDRDAARQAQLAAELAHTGRFRPYTVDLARASERERVLAELAQHLAGRCDALVNNAGLCRVRAFEASDGELLDELLAVNVHAPFHLTRGLLPLLQASGGAVVINIASELALIGQAGYSAYTATKGALLAWSRALAVELAPRGVRVNALCPGPIDTPMLQGEFATLADPQAARRREIESVPLRRLGAPAEVAAAVAFLASDAAAFVSGAAWVLDGGKTAC